MNPTITIEDTDEEVIDLDSSQDAINVTDNDQSECSIKKESLSNNNANKTNVTSDYVDNNRNVSRIETCDSPSTAKPLLKVMFRDESVSGQYSKRIKEFLEELVSSKIKSQENDNGLMLEVWDNDTDSMSQSIEITTESEDSQDIICDTLFTVDTQPKLKDDFDVPTYGKKYENVFDKTKTKSKSDANPKDCPPKLMCFNCLGNHNVRDCSEPRNYANIEKHRKSFGMKTNLKTLRYHLEDNQKFGHIIPGQLSDNLRKALGLRDNELPRHIYRMRMLGYPPGWLEEARLQHSGLSLFNSDGVAEEDPNDEPGAIIEEGDRDQYDIKKIYDFPGFNVPAPPGTRDEDGEYWVSTMLTVHSKQRMLLKLRGKRADDGYKRKKLKISNNAPKNSSASEPSEMEIENVEESVVECLPTNGLFVPPLPPESPMKPPEPPLPLESPIKPPESPIKPPESPIKPPESPIKPPESPIKPPESPIKPPESPIKPPESPIKPPESPIKPPESPIKPPEPPVHTLPVSQTISEDSDYHSQELQFSESPENSTSPSSRANSPSLSELENMKKQLLVELQESNSNSDVSSKSNSSNSVSRTDMPPPSNEATPESNRTRQNDANTSHGSVKSIDLGTPVLQSTSPYSKLPPSEKFSKNICNLINFENLPDSTGKYEQMTGVLQKVRNTLAKLHQD